MSSTGLFYYFFSFTSVHFLIARQMANEIAFFLGFRGRIARIVGYNEHLRKEKIDQEKLESLWSCILIMS